MVSSRGPWRWLRWVIGAVVVIIVLAVAGPFVYFHFIEGNSPAPLSLKPGASASGTQSASPVSSQGRFRVGGRKLGGGLRLPGRLPGQGDPGGPVAHGRRPQQFGDRVDGDQGAPR